MALFAGDGCWLTLMPGWFTTGAATGWLAAVELSGAPTARSQRWPGCPCCGFSATAPVAGCAAGMAEGWLGAGCAGWAITGEEVELIVVPVVVLAPEPEPQAVRISAAAEQQNKNFIGFSNWSSPKDTVK